MQGLVDKLSGEDELATAAAIEYKLILIDPIRGTREERASPTPFPDNVIIGELVLFPSAGVNELWVLIDRFRGWTGTNWAISDTVSRVPEGSTPEEIYKLRRELLTLCGWIK